MCLTASVLRVTQGSAASISERPELREAPCKGMSQIIYLLDLLNVGSGFASVGYTVRLEWEIIL